MKSKIVKIAIPGAKFFDLDLPEGTEIVNAGVVIRVQERHIMDPQSGRPMSVPQQQQIPILMARINTDEKVPKVKRVFFLIPTSFEYEDAGHFKYIGTFVTETPNGMIELNVMEDLTGVMPIVVVEPPPSPIISA